MKHATEPSHIGIVIPSLLGGGAERMMVVLANEFARRGHTVDLVVGLAEGTFVQSVAPEVRIISLESQRAAGCLPAMVRYLRRERPHVVLSALCHMNLVTLLARRLAGGVTRVVVSERSPTGRAIAHAPGLRMHIIRHLVRVLYPTADRIIAISGGVAADLANLAGMSLSQIDVIHNPANTPELKALSEEPIEHEWFAGSEVPIVLGVGRLAPAKDFPTLIAAFKRVRKSRQARLVILGEGEAREALERLVAEGGLEADCILPGFQVNPYKYMAASDVLVVSSQWEGFGNVLVEAMALGTPVVSTDCPGGPAEILENGRWGRLVPVGDAAQMARAIEASLDEKGPDPRTRALDFTLASIATQYLKLLL